MAKKFRSSQKNKDQADQLNSVGNRLPGGSASNNGVCISFNPHGDPVYDVSDKLYDVRYGVYDVCGKTCAETDNVYDVRDKTCGEGVPVCREGVPVVWEGDFVEFDSVLGRDVTIPALKPIVFLVDVNSVL